MGDILSKMQQQLVRNTQQLSVSVNMQQLVRDTGAGLKIFHWPYEPYRGNRQQSFDSNLEQILWNIRKLEQVGDGGALLDH